jgi:hypothetical protein
MAGKIFINYRRTDDPGFALAIYLGLEDEFAAPTCSSMRKVRSSTIGLATHPRSSQIIPPSLT